jgi:hypothetical protein
MAGLAWCSDANIATSTERKFLVDPNVWKTDREGVFFPQGYLSSEGNCNHATIML